MATNPSEVARMVAAVMALPRPVLVSEYFGCCSTTFTSDTGSTRTPADMHDDYHATVHREDPVPEDAPVVVDRVAYNCEGEDGLAWSCPECGVGGTNPDGEDAHNAYAHAATVTLEDGVYYLTPATRWGGWEYLPVQAANEYPGKTFALACECELTDGSSHSFGCGETFTVVPTVYHPTGQRLIQN